MKYPIIDMHTHLRNEIFKYTWDAKENGIDTIIYMANSNPPLDNLKRIKSSLNEPRCCNAYPVSAITKNLEGKKLVDVEKIKDFVVGFSDDGNYLEDIKILEDILSMGVLVLAQCSPPYEIGIENPSLETKYIERYLPSLEKTKGRLHIQHVSKERSVELIRNVKKQVMNLTCETCPHYFTYTRDGLDVKVNPPLAAKKDVIAVQEGLFGGTIDVIASDYSPFPRKTGIASFEAFISLSYGLVLRRVLTEKQLEEKISINPGKILNLK